MTKLQLQLLRQAKVKKNGFGLVELLVTCAIIGIILPVVFEIFMIPVYTQVKQANFQKAEMVASIYAQQARKSGELGEVPEGCELDEENEDDDVYVISCTRGSTPRVRATASVNIVFTYEDSTGFDDDDDEECDDEDDNKGHGNDCDGYDDDNPGKGKGKGKDKSWKF